MNVCLATRRRHRSFSTRHSISQAVSSSAVKPSSSLPYSNQVTFHTQNCSPEQLAEEFAAQLRSSKAKSSADSLQRNFIEVVRAGGLQFLSSEIIIRGSDFLPGVGNPGSINWRTEDESVMELRELLRHVVYELHRRESEKRNEKEPLPDFAHLRAHLLALEDDRDVARRYVRSVIQRAMLDAAPDSNREDGASRAVTARILRALTRIIAVHAKRTDLATTLHCVLFNWVALHPHLFNIKRSSLHWDARQAGDCMRKALFEAIVHLSPQPASWYRQHRDNYTDLTYRHIGEILIHCFCEQELPQRAHAVYEAMRQQNIPFSPSLTAHVLRTLTDHKMWPQAADVYAEFRMQMHTKFKSQFFLTTSMRYFSHKGDVASVEDIYSELLTLPEPITAAHQSWRLHVYAVLGDIVQMEIVWREFFPPPSPDTPDSPRPSYPHFVPLLVAYANIGDVEGINRCMQLMDGYGLTPGTKLFNEILRCFARRDDENAVFETMQRMQAARVVPNEATFLILIKMYGRLHNIFEAEKVFRAALSRGIRPTQRMVMELMRAHVSSSSWKGVIRIFDFMRRANPDKTVWLDIQVYNILVRAYVLIGSPFTTVRDMIDRLGQLGVEPNEETYLLGIQSACDSGSMHDGLQYFREMEELEHRATFRRSAESFALTILMAAYLKSGMRNEARAIYAMMLGRDIVPDAVTMGLIARAYGNERTDEGIRLAEEFLAGLADPGDADYRWLNQGGRGRALAWQNIYQPVIAAHAQRLDIAQVEKHFTNLLKASKRPPSIIALTPLMDAYRRVADTDSMRLVWERIFQTAIHMTSGSTLSDLLDRTTQEGAACGSATDKAFAVEEGQATRVLRSSILCVPLSVYILGLSDAARHEEIAQVWSEVQCHGFGFDNHNWSHLALALARAGEPARAFNVMERVILPSREEAQQSLSKRSSFPDSPLSFIETFTVEPVVRDNAEALGGDSAYERRHQLMEDIRLRRSTRVLHRGEYMHGAQPFRRARPGPASESGGRPELDVDGYHDEQASTVDERDVAGELHEYHQLSPAWNSWRPHRMTLEILSAILRSLAAGRLIRPAGPRIPVAEGPILNTSDGHNGADAARAYEMYQRLVRDSPRTMEVLSRFEAKKRRAERGVKK